MKLRILIIANQASGKKKINRYMMDITENFSSLGYITEVRYTNAQNNAFKIIKDYKYSYDIVVVYGNSATLNEACLALYELKKKVYIGYVPIGVVNDFGRTLNCSFDVLDISRNINNYDSYPIDTGVFNSLRVFNSSATFGTFSKASYNVGYKVREKLGKFGHFIYAFPEIFSNKQYRLKITCNNQSFENKFIYGSISNSEYLAGFDIFNTKDIELSDGKFEVILIKKPKNMFEKLKVLLKVLNGNLDDENIIYFKTDNIEIESSKKYIEWSLDGTYAGKTKVANIHVLKENFNFILPINEDDEY